MEMSKKKKMQLINLSEPDGGFVEALVGLALSEHVQVTAWTKLRQKTDPFRRIDGIIESRQKRMIQQFQYFPLSPRPPFFTPTRQFLLVHHFRGEHHTNITNIVIIIVMILELGQVDGADVAGAEAVCEAEVGGGEVARGGLGSDPVDGGPTRVGRRRVGFRRRERE